MGKMTSKINQRIIPPGCRRVASDEIILQGDWAATTVQDDGTIIWTPTNDVGLMARTSQFFHVCDIDRTPIKSK